MATLLKVLNNLADTKSAGGCCTSRRNSGIAGNIANIERNIEIVGADPATLHGFTQVPNFILTSTALSVGAKLGYAMLLKYAWGDNACYPGQTKLAEDMGSGERSVRRYLEEAASAATSKNWRRPASLRYANAG